MRDYYEKPTMVKFLNPNYFEDGVVENADGEEYWLGGIAYKDEIICGCCGGAFEIKGLMKGYGAETLKFEELLWINIVNEIIGD